MKYILIGLDRVLTALVCVIIIIVGTLVVLPVFVLLSLSWDFKVKGVFNDYVSFVKGCIPVLKLKEGFVKELYRSMKKFSEANARLQAKRYNISTTHEFEGIKDCNTLGNEQRYDKNGKDKKPYENIA